MLKLADQLTVPQIFFGNLHIGGATQLLDMEADKLMELYKVNVSDGDVKALSPLLLKPDYDPKPEPEPLARTEEVFKIGKWSGTFVETTEMLNSKLDVKSRRYLGKKYKDVVLGSEILDVLVATGELGSRGEALEVGRELQKAGIFSHVTKDHLLKDEALFFQLPKHGGKDRVLNSYRKWTDRVDPDAVKVVILLKKQINKLVDEHRDGSDGLVDYEAVGKDPAFVAFEEAVCELQGYNLAEMAENVQLAFVINLYNMMIPHAYAKLGDPRGDLARMTFFDKTYYNIGGQLYSFTDLENGVLRGNKTPPYHLFKPFGKGDSRAKAARLQVEPRIHFALNCGAKSCPPVKKFTAEAIDEELRIVAMSFLEQEDNCAVDADKNTLTLSLIFKWYSSDFGSNDQEMGKFVVQFLRGKKKESLEKALAAGSSFKIKYTTYDWGNDAKQGDHATNSSCVIM